MRVLGVSMVFAADSSKINQHKRKMKWRGRRGEERQLQKKPPKNNRKKNMDLIFCRPVAVNVHLQEQIRPILKVEE